MDTYKTILFPSPEILFKEKNSKFFGYAYPLDSEEEVKPIIESLHKKHPNAVHYCYSYQIGTDNVTYRANDDGEPSNTAGMPIYGQMQSFSLTNVLIVVVRFYGGVKLGVGGLIAAYRTAAFMTLESCEIIEKTINVHYRVLFDYKNINKVMRVIKEKNLAIISQKMEMSCEIEIVTRKKNAEIVFDIFNAIFEIEIESI
ncbi:IMPACT family protein [Flavobacterium cellulosilyticum]|uniref:YigZ family protein n=1 Tax=Flavobacterium cellulosilyticum TaxID=2541731 RepID=A0A4R5CB71_9FLAO|nr:YigZ family protein [Flavobacterium cellulosilyticum]TDD94322.1 YigZ family protein [Flavobacterium cellulosilyticum]